MRKVAQNSGLDCHVAAHVELVFTPPMNDLSGFPLLREVTGRMHGSIVIVGHAGVSLSTDLDRTRLNREAVSAIS